MNAQIRINLDTDATEIFNGEAWIPTYVQEDIDQAFEKGRQLGMRQERALWELAHSTQEIEK